MSRTAGGDVDLALVGALVADPGRCQILHLAGGLGRGVLDRLLELVWIRRSDSSRAVRITGAGRDGLRTTFGVDLS